MPLRRASGRIKTLWHYRGLVLSMVARDFQSRYLGSILGATWVFVNPLTQILIYTLVFSHVMGARLAGVPDPLAYGLYLCAGLLPWSYFAEVITRSQTVFLEQANMLKKVNFPHVTLPVYVFCSASVNSAIMWGLFLAFLLVAGRWPGWALAGILPLLFVQQTLALGLGVLFGVINVFFRDVAQAIGVGLQLWFWLTPIVYPASVLPERVQPIIAWNPIYPLVGSYQRIIVQQQWPVWTELWWVAAIALVVALLSGIAFRRLAGAMVDEL